jgi:hypothetical protein
MLVASPLADLGPNLIFNFTESSIHWIQYIIEGINEKLHKVFDEIDDITTPQSSGGNSKTLVLLHSEQGNKIVQ